jgi:putative peptidoglycan lipid II flippase
VLFPYLSQSALTGDGRDLRRVSAFGLNLMVIVLVPVSVLCVTLNSSLVELLFQRGKFNEAAAQLTAGALTGYSLGLTFNGLGYVFPRILLALEKNHVVAFLGCGNVVLKVLYNTLLIPTLGQTGIALGTSLMYATTDVFFLAALFYYGIRLDLRVMLKGLAFGAGLGGLVLIISLAAKIVTRSPSVQVFSVAVCVAGLSYVVYRSRGLRSLLSLGTSRA